jgi:Protein of unknown function (DUF3105)
MDSVSEQDQSDGHEEETVGRLRRLHILVVSLGMIAGAALGAFLPLVLLSDRHQASSDVPGVKSFENLSLQHNNGSINYEQIPPVGGEHNPVWQNAGFYEQQVIEEKAVHTLEHGAVWITYRADLPENQKEELRRIVESQDCLLASPYPSLSSPVVASAWGKQLRLKSVDDPKLQEFIVAYRKGPQTPESGAPCTGAVEKMNPPPKDDDQ